MNKCVLLTFHRRYASLPCVRRDVHSSILKQGDAIFIVLLVHVPPGQDGVPNISARKPGSVISIFVEQRLREVILRLWQDIQVWFPERLLSINILPHQVEESYRLDFELVSLLSKHGVLNIHESVQKRQSYRMRSRCNCIMWRYRDICTEVKARHLVVQYSDAVRQVAFVSAKPCFQSFCSEGGRHRD